jgi:hypothetical protein
MPGIQLRQVHLDTFRQRAPASSVVIKLMMACNDMAHANQALADWKAEARRERSAKKHSAGMYFVRTQMAHLYEGMKIIEEIANSAELMTLVDRCDEQTKQSFADLKSCLRGGAKHQHFNRLIGQVRHNVTFHYHQSGELIDRAAAALASQPERRTSSVTRGSDAYRWHFKLADDIIDNIVVHQIWQVEPGASVSEEADGIADELHRIFLSYMDFAGEFIWRYCER